MAGVDPFDQLVALGVITRAQLNAAHAAPASATATTTAAHLVALGVDAGALLDALASTSSLPVATRATLDRACPIAIPPSYAKALRDLVAAPVGRGDDGKLEVVVADPRASRELSSIGLAHRASLAIEADVRAAMAKAFPSELPSDDTAASTSSPPAPIAFAAPSPAILAAPEPAFPAPPSSKGDPTAEAQLPRPITLPSESSSQAPVNVAETVEVRPVSTAIDGARASSTLELPPVRTTDVANAAWPTMPLSPAPSSSSGAAAWPTMPLAPAAASSPSTAGDGASSSPQYALSSSARPLPAPATTTPREEPPRRTPLAASETTASAFDRRRNMRRAMVVALPALALLIVCVVIAVVVANRPPPPEDKATAQRRMLEEARALAARGEHAWSFARCSDAMKIDPTTTAGKEAAILCDEQNVLLGEREGLFDLKRIIDGLAPSDPLRAEAEATLKRLPATDTGCDACDVDAGSAKPHATAPPKRPAKRHGVASKATHK